MSPAPAHPSATVVLLRDSAEGIEVLYVRRSRALRFHGGAWVFPGGRVDAADAVPSAAALTAARRAGVREVQEESGLALESESLVPVARWITPELSPRRFDALFFAARAPAGPVRVDGGEIHEHRWLAPRIAIQLRERGELELPPPTFVTSVQLADFADSETALAQLAARPLEEYRPRLHKVAGGGCSLYPGDAGYAENRVECEGPRHRLWMLDCGWRYERQP